MDRSVLAVVTEAMRLDLGLTDMQMGLIHSILLIVLMLLIIPCSALCDIFGRRKMLTMAAGLWSIGIALTGTAGSFAHLLVGRMCSSFNDAFTGSGGSSWVSVSYPPEMRGRKLGLFHMSSPLGMALGTLLGGLVLTILGTWRACFLALLIPALFLLYAIPRLPDPENPVGRAAVPTYLQGLKTVLLCPSVLLLGLAVGFYTTVLMVYQAWMPTLLIRIYSLNGMEAGMLFACMVMGGMAGPYIGGSFADAWYRKTEDGRPRAAALLIAGITLEKLCFYSLLGKIGLPLVLLLGLVDGVATMMVIPVHYAIAQDIVTPQYRNLVMGVMGGICFLCGAAWGPLLTGIVSERFGGGAEGLRCAMIVILAFSALSAAVYRGMCGQYLKDKHLAEHSGLPPSDA